MVDSSTRSKGILASLETTRVAARPHRLDRFGARGPALVVGSGVLAGVLLSWWVLSGPSPVMLHEPQPAPQHEVQPAAAPAAEDEEAAAIVDERPPAATAAVAALAPAPIATVVIRRERSTPPQRVHARVARREAVIRPPAHLPAPDGDVALLTALVAHSNPDSARDVVEPRLADSTEMLLQRCLRVGGEEGRLCQARICAVRTADNACRTQ